MLRNLQQPSIVSRRNDEERLKPKFRIMPAKCQRTMLQDCQEWFCSCEASTRNPFFLKSNVAYHRPKSLMDMQWSPVHSVYTFQIFVPSCPPFEDSLEPFEKPKGQLFLSYVLRIESDASEDFKCPTSTFSEVFLMIVKLLQTAQMYETVELNSTCPNLE